jgi:hypothetical protein
VRKINAVTGKDVLSAYALSQVALEYGCTIYLTGNMGKDDRGAIFATPLEDVSSYGGKDSAILLDIYHFQMQEINSRGPAYSRLPNLIQCQINSMLRAFVEMERTGLPVDRLYLTKEVASGGAFVEARQKEREEIYATEACIKANAILVKKFVGGDIFNRASKDMWVFDIDVIEHQCVLFFDVLKLKPLKIGKNGLPSTDKMFKDAYAPLDDSGKLLEDIAVPEVSMFRSYSELKHLYNSFLKGFYNKLFEDIDMRKDGKLRPNFKYLDIVTGRCFVGNTPVYVLDEREKVNIKDLKTGDWLWSFNVEKRLPEPAQVIKQWRSGFRSTVRVKYRVRRRNAKGTFWQIKTLECTADHPFLLTNGEYVEASKLKPKTRLQALERRQHREYRDLLYTGQLDVLGSATLPEHRVVALGEHAGYEARSLLSKYNNHEVISVKFTKKKQWVYDITVSKNANFVANGCVVHNCGAEKPSLQQVPSRSKLAKAIKRQFITLEGQLYIQGDYASHEVRQWAIASNEINLIDTYVENMILKRQFRLLKQVTDPKDWENKFKMLDLHRKNCRLFYGVEPIDVDKAMRARVKTTVFGVVYGMSAISLSIRLHISEEEAQELINTLFEKFPDGTLYITDTHERGMKYLVVVSGIGRVRHLWGYLHTNYGVYGAMDRRGVNSKIQSIASDEGFEGHYQVQRLRWELFHKQGLPLKFDICNAIHDSCIAMTNIQTIPVAAYLLEHSFTSCVHNSYLENFGFDFSPFVGLEVDCDIGPSLGEMHDWNYRPEEMERIVEESVKWQQDVLKYRTAKDTFKKFYDNLDMMHELRCAELRKQPDNGVNREMLLTAKLAKEVAL